MRIAIRTTALILLVLVLSQLWTIFAIAMSWGLGIQLLGCFFIGAPLGFFGYSWALR